MLGAAVLALLAGYFRPGRVPPPLVPVLSIAVLVVIAVALVAHWLAGHSTEDIGIVRFARLHPAPLFTALLAGLVAWFARRDAA